MYNNFVWWFWFKCSCIYMFWIETISRFSTLHCSYLSKYVCTTTTFVIPCHKMIWDYWLKYLFKKRKCAIEFWGFLFCRTNNDSYNFHYSMLSSNYYCFTLTKLLSTWSAEQWMDTLWIISQFLLNTNRTEINLRRI